MLPSLLESLSDGAVLIVDWKGDPALYQLAQSAEAEARLNGRTFRRFTATRSSPLRDALQLQALLNSFWKALGH